MRASIIVLLGLVAFATATMSTQRHVFYTRSKIPTLFSIVGFPAPTDSHKFMVALNQRNLDKLEARFWAMSDPASPEYQNFMTKEEVLDLISPPESERRTVIDWLVSCGCNDIEDRGDALAVTSTVGMVETIFQTKMYLFKNKETGAVVTRQMGDYSIPAELKPFIRMVTGLSDFPMIHRPKVFGPEQASPAVIPQTLQTVYEIPASATASSVSQGVGEFGSGEYYNPDGLQTFAQQVGLTIPPLNNNTVITPLPPSGIEGDLDIQYISALAPGATNWYWTGADWLYDWSNAVFAGAPAPAPTARPQVISLSYGWSELAQCDIDTTECSALGFDSQQYVAYTNTEFMKIGSLGVSLLCASGDSGANGRTDPDCTTPQLRPAYPAASPYITSVGATQLVNPETNLPNPPPVCSTGSWSCASGGQETAVSFDQSSFTSGGGFSNYVPRPSYQAAAVAAYFKSGVQFPPASYYNASNRGLPDVASLGSAILIYSAQEGGIAAVGGTSASSPSFAGYMSLLNNIAVTKTGKPMGFLNPFLYKMYADDPSTFRDITIGDNICTEDGCASSCQGFYCAKGWDPVTGLGVANVANMIKYVSAMFDKKVATSKTAAL